MAATNPFVYGEIVSAGAFADREAERERLTRDLSSGQKVFLISPRRYGKSSLVRDVLRGLARKGTITVEVTVAASSSYVGFLESYARALVSADTPQSGLRRWAADLLAGARHQVRLETGTGRDASFTLSFPAVRTPKDAARLASDVFAMPERIAAARGRPLAIALDEFQAIAAFDGDSAEQALRAAVQTQRDVGYVFAGSEPSLMERMVGPKRPFYKAGPVMRLEKIVPGVFADWLDARFTSTGVKVEPGLGAAIVDLAGNVPYDVQRLAHELWDDLNQQRRRTASLDDLHATLTRLLAEQHTVYEELWQRLTLAQRGVLRALVLEDGREMLSGDVRTRHRLGGASSVQAALAALVRQDVIMKDASVYLVTDSLYREWVARTTF